MSSECLLSKGPGIVRCIQWSCLTHGLFPDSSTRFQVPDVIESSAACLRRPMMRHRSTARSTASIHHSVSSPFPNLFSPFEMLVFDSVATRPGAGSVPCKCPFGRGESAGLADIPRKRHLPRLLQLSPLDRQGWHTYEACRIA